MWVPSLYFVEGAPYVAVMTVSVIMYKRLGISNSDIALYTGWLYLPWVIKPFWSPLIDLFKTKRWWIVVMQISMGAGFASVALTIPLPFFFQITLAFFWLLAFSSATHDIAADGFYMLALNDTDQAKYVGIRSLFYRAATILGQGFLVILAGFFEKIFKSNHFAWSIVFFILAGMFLVFGLYHRFYLPKKNQEQESKSVSVKSVWKKYKIIFLLFFRKREIVPAIFFMLTYRLSEAQALKLINPFLLDTKEAGGLALSTEKVGLVYGVFGAIALTLGGIIGGLAAASDGLRKWLWPMTISMLSTIGTFVYLSFSQTDNLWIINSCVFIEQFGYGFGFTAYTLYLMYFSEGKYKTAHYAFCTGFMALGMMLPGMAAGWLQEQLGYNRFFIWVMICCAIPMVAVSFLKIDPYYGKKR
jgi:PAT family beta-lactamase induction signal transducer AmpG